jgi:flagellar basal-body rod protein FlgB
MIPALTPSIRGHSTLPALEQSLVFSQRRHALLAGNVANVSTPDYQARDLSVDAFQTALADSIRASQTPSPGTTSPGVQRSAKEDPLTAVRESMEHILFHDGSDNNLEMTVTELAKNQMMHNTAISLMRSQFRVLEMAISERV